ncbi:MAG: hypothetical protein JSV33_10675 [bacterium]|nr:MAG: hypothetical protein JSV33_10675 [bacterium]
MLKCVVLLLSLALVLVAPAYAVTVNACLTDWGTTCPLRVAICPQGDFQLIREGCGGCCDYIWVLARDAAGSPVWGVPVNDYYLQACDPTQELCLCVNPIIADSITNEDGFTTISGTIAGGGCVGEMSPGIALAVGGNFIVDEPLCVDIHCEPITIVSPDLTADCQVSLSDLAIFGFSYLKDCGHPDYNECCDYNGDCIVDLSDFAYFAMHYQHMCIEEY